MSKCIDYYFTPVSPYTWLGHARLREIAARQGADIALHVVDLSRVLPVSGGIPLKDRAPQRQAYRLLELARWREFLGVPLNIEPKYFPVPAQPAATTILAVAERHGTEVALDVAGDVMRALWVEERNIADASTLANILSERRLNAGPLLMHAVSAEIEERFEAHTREAIERGVFGSPSVIVDGELFWGQDRLDFVERKLAGMPQ
ncbi:MAG: 2-hydroxychromene-2-carboxylate isomerase [Burkholderiaceae bacterium]